MDNELDNVVDITFDKLPEAKDWKVGKAYRVKTVLRMTGSDEDGATFEVVDATSMEPADKGKQSFLSEGGYFKG